jgi:hypothetical protein
MNLQNLKLKMKKLCHKTFEAVEGIYNRFTCVHETATRTALKEKEKQLFAEE